jgi:hypothetical protein
MVPIYDCDVATPSTFVRMCLCDVCVCVSVWHRHGRVKHTHIQIYMCGVCVQLICTKGPLAAKQKGSKKEGGFDEMMVSHFACVRGLRSDVMCVCVGGGRGRKSNQTQIIKHTHSKEKKDL